MTRKEKIAVSLPAQLVRAAKGAVRKGRAPSVSAYVADAITDKVLMDDLGALLDEMLAETGGPLTKSEIREAERMLGHGSKKRR